MGEVRLAATVREDTQGGTTAPLLAIATTVPDDGETDPHEFLRGVLSGMLEYVYDDLHSPERPTDRVSTWGAPRG